uniref:C-type lectin domain-containing protein n=1 Tax=Rhinolophus ferrumequinum TaxID=59479 RepID=A0A671EUZ3_RHIFE
MSKGGLWGWRRELSSDGVHRFWKEGEPNNLRDKDRVQLPGDGWNDTECSVEDLWICKKPFARCPGL